MQIEIKCYIFCVFTVQWLRQISTMKHKIRCEVGFWHFNLQIEIKIWAQMMRIVIPYLKPFLSTSKLKIEKQIEMKQYILCSTVAA